MHDDSLAPAGFTWDVYLSALLRTHGSLTTLAEKLALQRGFEDDVASIEKALRRLRGRGLRPGGKWGTRLVSLFGLPGAVEARLRWMAAYHSRFTDLPVAVCEDLIRLWDHPPTTERGESRACLALARASLALRRNDLPSARDCLAQVELEAARLPIELELEALLVHGYIASKDDPSAVSHLLARVEPLLERVASPEERACFEARFTDQSAYQLNRAGSPAAAEALYRRLPSSGTPPFVAARRENGLAYALWKQGKNAEATQHARASAEHAGDGGHVRLRAMALGMLARIESERARSQATCRRHVRALGRRNPVGPPRG
ncbi:MAG: hypothetical protein QM756_12150 [Polyangiaceae bacterium]